MGLRTALGLKKGKAGRSLLPMLSRVRSGPRHVHELYAKYPSLYAAELQLRVDGRQGALALAPKNGIGVELGVFTGRFSEVLFRATSPKKLFLVDGWGKIYGSKFPNWGAYTDYGRLSTEAALRLVQARAQHLNGDIQIVEETSTMWLAKQPPKSLDWAYVDTSHSYENTMQELRLLDDALKENGVILGDDCRIDPTHRHHGVFLAIKDFCKEAGFEIVHMDTAGQWAIRRSPNQAAKGPEVSSVTTLPAPATADIDVEAWFEGKRFTSDWLTPKLKPWIASLSHLAGTPAEVLDVGSYEGRSCVAFLNLLPHCCVTAIDTFCSDEVTLKTGQPSEVEANFDFNISFFPGRVRKLKDRAVSALDMLQQEEKVFDVIYLDAAKLRDAALVHSVMAWPLLRKGGVLLWDDLKWGGTLPSRDRPSDAILLFADVFRDCIEVLHHDRQMIVRKLSDWPVGASSA